MISPNALCYGDKPDILRRYIKGRGSAAGLGESRCCEIQQRGGHKRNEKNCQFFHVDRLEEFAGSHTQLMSVSALGEKHRWISDRGWTLIEQWFPRGLSRWGDFWLLHDHDHRDPERSIELTLEIVRRSLHPDRVSRFQGLFGFDSLERAEDFASSHDCRDKPIWEITAASWFMGDMKWLKACSLPVEEAAFAWGYWSGVPFDAEPDWEFVLSLPVDIVRRVR
jgi:hypothetical protein